MVREVDHAAKTEALEAGALHRVVLRTRESPGLINVFAGLAEARAPHPAEAASQPAPVVAVPAISMASTTDDNPPIPLAIPAEPDPPKFEPPEPPEVNEVYRTGSYQDWQTIIIATGELIAAVERGINAAGGDFGSLFHAVRVELADDYTFLDPFTQAFTYSAGVAALKGSPEVGTFASAISELLRRVVNRAAVGDRARRVRERIALEMLPIARRRADVLERSGLQAQLDRIAGTRVM